MLEIDENKLDLIKDYLVTQLFRNPEFMYDEIVEELEIAEIICDLFEYLHILITGLINVVLGLKLEILTRSLKK